MGRYRVTLKIDFFVDITEENLMADPRPPLQGDAPEAALNRVVWCWLKGRAMARDTCRLLGVGRTWLGKNNMEVVRLEDPPSPVSGGQ